MTVVCSKTPLRVSFFGGGTDIPAYYSKRGGAVISTTIDKHVYIAANRCVANHVKVTYSDFELVSSADEVQHDRVRESLRFMGVESNVEICSFSDIPTKGSGLGSSSTFTVGLVNTLQRLNGLRFTEREAAEYACWVEIDLCDEPIGKQDQYAASFGGFNYMTFDDEVNVCRVNVSHEHRQTLEDNLMMFSTGFTRPTARVLTHQVNALQREDARVFDKLDQMKEMAALSRGLIEGGMVDDFGALLDDAWEIKRALPGGVTNPFIDEMYEAARKAGALGGKILGAGDGGYLLVYAQPQFKSSVRDALLGHDELHFKFTSHGSSVTEI